MVHLYNENSSYRHDVYINTVFVDNDDVAYKAPKDQDAYHKLAAIRAVQMKFPDMSNKQLERLIDKGRAAGKGSLDFFVERLDMDGEELRANHYKQLIKLTKEFPQFFEDPESPYGDIAKLRIAGVNFHMITHGNLEWTQYTMSKGERPLSDFFSHQAQSVTCKDEMHDFSGKTKTEIYERGLDKMNVSRFSPKRGLGSAMVEDTMKNLKAAKELGMMTIFINRQNIDISKIADYVDVVVKNSNEALHVIMHSNMQHEIDPRFDPNDFQLE